MRITTYHARLHTLKKLFLTHNCDAVIISQKENIFYLTGLASIHPTERESFLFLTPQKNILYHSPFLQPPHQKSWLECIPMAAPHSFQSVIHPYSQSIATLGIEKNNLTITEHERLSTILPHATFSSIEALPRSLRIIKDKQEISLIKKARIITAKVLKWAQKFTASSSALGITEIELKNRIEQQMQSLGADGLAFPTIVAFDKQTAFPHHQPRHHRLIKNSIVLVDLGAKVGGYGADMTRTWCLKKPSPQFSHIEAIVKKAHAAAFSLVRARRDSPVTAQAIDNAARQVITKAGFSANFIHTTGHGLGLEAHEPPSISTENLTFLMPGIVITIEPGIYIPNTFGYRHEDTVII